MGKSAIRCPACSALNPPTGALCADCGLAMSSPVRPFVAVGLILFVLAGIAVASVRLIIEFRAKSDPVQGLATPRMPAAPLAPDSAEVAPLELAEHSARELLDQRKYAELDVLFAAKRALEVETPYGTAPLEDLYQRLSDPRPAASETVEHAWQRHADDVRRYATERPRVAAFALLAHVMRSWAWQARGTGWGKDVTPEGWRLFGERLEDAEAACVAAADNDDKAIDPWYVWTAIGRGKSYSRAQFERMVNRGLARRADCTAIHRGFVKYLLPRWGGKEGEWEAYAAKVAAADDVLYAQICDSPATSWHEDFFRDTKASWPRIHRGMQAWMQRSPQSTIVASRFAWWAWKAGERDVARALFKRLGERYEPSVWVRRQDYEAARGFAL